MYHFIANPNARSGQGLALWEKIKLKLIAEHIDYQIHFTHHRHHATEIAAELTASGDPVTIVVLGGDGSVDEVICCYLVMRNFVVIRQKNLRKEWMMEWK